MPDRTNDRTQPSTDPPKQYVHAATSIVLRGWGKFPLFFRLTRRVIKRMERMPGLLDQGFRARLGQRCFLTASVWTDRMSMGKLMASEEHRVAVRAFDEIATEDSATATWMSESPKIDWAEAARQIRENPVYPERSRGSAR